MDKAFCLGFVVYFPTREFIERLDFLVGQGYSIYIFDNSPECDLVRCSVRGKERVRYITAGKNLGLGVGISAICANAYYDAKTFLLFFDQDTAFSAETLDHVSAFIEHWRGCQSGKQYLVVAFDSREANENKPYDVQDVDLVISSGSLFTLDRLHDIGWHNEKYFVDGVDYELCYRARRAGYGIGRCGGTPGFDHVSEQPDRQFRVGNKSYPLRRYSKSRVLDSIRAYLRLSGRSLVDLDFLFLFRISRSFLIYMAGQILARIVLR
jgi:rhamnosyltransferase